METLEDKKKKWIEVYDIGASKCKALAATCKVLSTESQANLIMSEFVAMITDFVEFELSNEKVSDKMYDVCNTMKVYTNIYRNDLKSQLQYLKRLLEIEIVSKYGCDCILFHKKDGIVAVISVKGNITAMM